MLNVSSQIDPIKTSKDSGSDLCGVLSVRSRPIGKIEDYGIQRSAKVRRISAFCKWHLRKCGVYAEVGTCAAEPPAAEKKGRRGRTSEVGATGGLCRSVVDVKWKEVKYQ